jgi:hypothetical protein
MAPGAARVSHDCKGAGDSDEYAVSTMICVTHRL